jgi:hypothetical protein
VADQQACPRTVRIGRHQHSIEYLASARNGVARDGARCLRAPTSPDPAEQTISDKKHAAGGRDRNIEDAFSRSNHRHLIYYLRPGTREFENS